MNRLFVLANQLGLSVLEIFNLYLCIKSKHSSNENEFKNRQKLLSEIELVAWDKIEEVWNEPEFNNVGDKLLAQSILIKRFSEYKFNGDWNDCITEIQSQAKKEYDEIVQKIISYIDNDVRRAVRNRNMGNGELSKIIDEIREITFKEEHTMNDIEECYPLLLDLRYTQYNLGIKRIWSETLEMLEEEHYTLPVQILLCDAYDIVYEGKEMFSRISTDVINEKILIKEALGVAFIKAIIEG